ncbi:replication protein A 70 kDa DNA-binding subunit E-like isoform X2 [Lotus japonicus]|uniref:replication protein A 70 kDa DNA-binding subunit E-like isoform X2 n=1 Tax=Lotus japonicus TaxID=34305 RepID=UPI00258E1165|nr:replication protein A 70 kDa DNA-binding subunit E-like isoform X2 [Lotus japonicus]
MFLKWGDKFIEGNVYKITFGRLIPNMGGYRATEHPYKIFFIDNTTVVQCENTEIPMWGLSLKNSDQVRAVSGQADHLVGLLTSVIEERTCVKKSTTSKMMIIELADDKGKIECVLFDEHARFVTEYLSMHSTEEAILVFQFAKIKTFRGKTVLQGVTGASRLSFNPQIPEVLEFWNGIALHGCDGNQQLGVDVIDIGVVSLFDDFIKNHPQKSVRSLNETMEDGEFIVRAKIMSLLQDDNWWYLACKCHRAVIVEDGHHYCSGCFRRVNYVAPRFRIKIQVSDGDDLAEFVMPDLIAENLINKSCMDILNEVKDPNAFEVAPTIEDTLVGRDLLFKVEKKVVNLYNYEEPYHVKRVCDDSDIIKAYMSNSSAETPILAKFTGAFSVLNVDDYDIDMDIDLLTTCIELGVPDCVKPGYERSKTEHGSCSKSYKRKLEEEFDEEFDSYDFKLKDRKFESD